MICHRLHDNPHQGLCQTGTGRTYCVDCIVYESRNVAGQVCDMDQLMESMRDLMWGDISLHHAMRKKSIRYAKILEHVLSADPDAPILIDRESHTILVGSYSLARRFLAGYSTVVCKDITPDMLERCAV